MNKKVICSSDGALYDAGKEQLLEARSSCKDLCYEYNLLKPSMLVEQRRILDKILGSLGENAVITAPFWCDYGTNIHIGKNFYANHNLVILDAAPVNIGDNVFIAPNCVISTAAHPIEKKKRDKGLETARKITIGNSVWIGAGAIILGGVTIGDGTVIGAGSVVNRSIPSNVVAVGNPCRPIRSVEINKL